MLGRKSGGRKNRILVRLKSWQQCGVQQATVAAGPAQFSGSGAAAHLCPVCDAYLDWLPLDWTPGSGKPAPCAVHPCRCAAVE